MDVRTLRTLLAIVDHRSFAAAGEAVGLSPSGVSLQIKALEEDLGLQLFDRRARPPRLTPDGELFVGRARDAVGVWERLTDGFETETLVGALELGAVPTIASGILPLALRRLRDRNPALRIKLTTDLSHELERLLRKGALDAAVLTQPTRVPPGLTWASFCEEPLVVIAPRNSAGETDRELLRSAPFIRFRRYAWAGRLIDQELQRRGIKVTIGMEVDSLEIIVSLVAQGLGVSVVPRRNIAKPLPKGVKSVPFGDPVVTRTLGVLQPMGSPRAHFVQQLFDELAGLSPPLEETMKLVSAGNKRRA